MNGASTISDEHGKCLIVIYPDEFPLDGSLLSDSLASLYAPLATWRQIAVEYFRLDMVTEFRSFLSEIVSKIDKKGAVAATLHLCRVNF